ncbi:hypothetical protein [Neobacillus sp. PS2-9]|uniref:hypothetical protein n=1 Tax=Neobacillus sp. PS2-9 TaxID=3070676 RepID=UPI0027DF5010|nr:hypothetical protein [Neobacillus sp. PS2-9]WML58605.1 hypothetical protein RCG25_02085 [Neobacillus sp. PS2-9]
MRRQEYKQKKRKKIIIFLLTTLVICVLIYMALKNPTTNDVEPKRKAHINHTVQKPNNITQTPEQYGANGFDKKPDTAALQKAINNGDTVMLKSSARYIIDKTLVIDHSIKIKTDGNHAAAILQKEKKSALVFDNKSTVNTYVTSYIPKNQPFVVLASTKGIQPGDLLELKSSKLWYWDDRGYLTKGELHKVIKLDGNKVYLERPIVENYLVGNGELVSVTAYPNVSFTLDNISFLHSKPYNTVMLQVNFASNAQLDRISVTNSKRIGILLNNTYQTKVSHANIDLGTTKDIDTGYGIQDFGGSGTLITDSQFRRVRRGVDFSGNIPSRYGIVQNSKAIGYKKGSLASGNSGFGTHSTAEYITFKNNYIENFNYAFLVRGREITVEDNILRGFSSNFIAVSYGDQVRVINNKYLSVQNSSISGFILIPKTYNGSLEAFGNVASGQNGPFIKGDIDQLKSLTLKENVSKSK